MPSKIFWGMQHLNANVLAAVTMSYTMTDTENAEPYELCILPLNDQLEPHHELLLFNMRMKIDAPELVDWRLLNKKDVADSQVRGMDREQVAFMLHHWFMQLILNRSKKIVPVTFGWPPIRDVLIRWLGYEAFNSIFDEDYRDIRVAAHYANDKLACSGEPVVYSKQTMSWIAKQLHVERKSHHNLVEDCMTIAQCYRRMLQT